MKRRTKLAITVMAVLLIGVISVLGMGVMDSSAEAGSKDQSYRWLAATGMTEFGPLCTFPTPCPDAAKTSSGETMEITGEGTLRLNDKKRGRKKGRKSATGGGSYRHLDKDGAVIDIGTWTVKRLIRFEDSGPDLTSGCCPERWRAGDALFKVELVSDDTGMKTDGVLRLGCQLPENKPAGSIEGIRIDIPGVGNFDMAPDPDPMRSTLFIRLG